MEAQEPPSSPGHATPATWGEWTAKFGLQGVLTRGDVDRAWAPEASDRKAAWKLYTEIRSRITTQPLHFRSGDEETALTSVYELFPRTRQIIVEEGVGCGHFADLSMAVLNTAVRPFTAKWHRKKTEGRLGVEDERRRFRAELTTLQERHLRAFEGALRSLALDEAPEAARVRATPESAPPPRRRPWNPPTSFVAPAPVAAPEQPEGGRPARKSSPDILAKERASFHEGIQSRPYVGLALSGGGIRSATFCLGVLQVLARHGVLAQVHYLSTVSGGGYIGAFLSRCLGTWRDGAVAGERELFGDMSPAIFHLRKRAHHHLLGDKPLRNSLVTLVHLAGAQIANLLVLGFLVGIAVLLRWALWSWTGGRDLSTDFWVGTGIIAGSSLLLAWSTWWFGRLIPQLAVVTGCVLGVMALGGLVQLAGLVLDEVAAHPVSTWWAGGALIPTAGIVAARVLRMPRLAAVLLELTAAVIVPVLTVLLYVIATNTLVFGDPSVVWMAAAWSILVAGAIVTFLASINRTSPHDIYKRRLAETYLSTPTGKVDAPRLSELNAPEKKAPYHLINATVNLPASRQEALRGRDSEVFVFSKDHCGSQTTGYFETSEFEKLDGTHLDLGTAIAISGAAASSQMGTLTVRRRVALMTLLNIRLGYWLRWPGAASRLPYPWARYLFVEMMSLGREGMPFLNLSDGGHVENLGIYELLRRKCRFIMSVDAEADAGLTCAGLAKALRQAQIDLGVEVEIDLSDIALNARRQARGHFQVGVIRYPDQDIGYLLYLKSSLTGDEGRHLEQYRVAHPTFPHESTGDQFFDEEQFEVYRQLGRHVGERAVGFARPANPDDPVDVYKWLDDLRANLLPDDHSDLCARPDAGDNLRWRE